MILKVNSKLWTSVKKRTNKRAKKTKEEERQDNNFSLDVLETMISRYIYETSRRHLVNLKPDKVLPSVQLQHITRYIIFSIFVKCIKVII